jgi:protoporphyrinogen oxidase
MSATWIAERVSVVDYERALENVRAGRDDRGWGPNNTFKFPRSGGTGEIYRRVAEALGARVRFGRELAELDAERRELRFADGSVEGYDAVVTTMPVDLLVGRIAAAPAELARAAAELRHNSVAVVGVAYELPLEKDTSWMYFPDGDAPFYRATNFAKYSPANVPGGDTERYSSYMTETAYRPEAPPDRTALERRVVAALSSSGVVEGTPEIASVHTIDVEYAYPVPTLGRDAALAVIQDWLMERDIYSRGRFGSWRYELGNMDHAVKMGVDVARLLVEGRPEELWRT